MCYMPDKYCKLLNFCQFTSWLIYRPVMYIYCKPIIDVEFGMEMSVLWFIPHSCIQKNILKNNPIFVVLFLNKVYITVN